MHAAVTLNHKEDQLDKPFELLGSIYALYPTSVKLLDHHHRPPLYYALEQRWGIEKLSWFIDKSLDTVLEKDSDGLSLITHALLNNCPEELVIRLAVAAASRCIFSLDELLDGQHFESARRVRSETSLLAKRPKPFSSSVVELSRISLLVSRNFNTHNAVQYLECVDDTKKLRVMQLPQLSELLGYALLKRGDILVLL